MEGTLWAKSALYFMNGVDTAGCGWVPISKVKRKVQSQDMTAEGRELAV